MEWISVKEKFPTIEEQTLPNRILVWFDDGSELMGVQPSYTPIKNIENERFPYMGPSHWMPCPKAPEKS